MFHRSEKAIRYARELDEARLNAHWHSVPNLARKLIKHDHEKQCVAKSALCEKTLNDLVAPLERTQREESLQYDSPNHLALPPEIRTEKMQDIVKSVEEAMNAPGSTEEKRLAKVVLSQMWVTMGQWKKVIDTSEQFVTGNTNIDIQGYSYVLILKAFAYNGIAYEGLEKFSAALETYLRASDFIHTSHTPTSYYSVQHWISKIMYRLCMLSLRLQETSEAIQHFRRYKLLVDTNFRISIRERLAVYYWYWRSLSDTLKETIQKRRTALASEVSTSTVAEKADNNDVGTIGSQVDFYELKEELSEMQSQYESVLVDASQFPRAGSSNQRVLDFVDRAMENWRLQGSDPNDAKGLVQVLYRAAAKTFQSPRVMRHLVYALEASGNYVEAERSLHAYLLIVENEKKTLARIRNSSSLSLEDERVIQDIDSDQDIIRTMATGVRLLVKYQNNGKGALEVALTMEESVKSWNIDDPAILGTVWHAIGIAHSLWSMQSSLPSLHWLIEAIEADFRQTVQSTAITDYTTALSYTPNALETYYQLALQHSIQRNLEKSIAALSHALRLKKSHVPSIHLLALVLTALGDYEKALQTCHTVKSDQLSNLPLDDAIALMEMQLTYLRIVEMVSGKDLAVEVQKGVFTMYNRIFGPVKQASGYIKKETDLEQYAEPQLRRTRSNVPERTLNPKASLGRESMESKLSLQVPTKRLPRTRSLLKRRPRSRSVDGRSMDTRSSGSVSEKPPSVSSEINHTPIHNVPEASLPPPNRGVGDTRSAAVVVQRLPNHASDVPSKYTSSPSEKRDQVAKLYRSKLWLACAGIYRRAGQWEGAQAAIQDALLCDTCLEEIFTELGSLHLDRGNYFEAMAQFERALLLCPDFPPAVVGLARTLLTFPNDKDAASSRDRAEVLLDSVTKLGGWDSSEAWFWLGEIYERCYMPVKAAECWTYCEELEERRPIREWGCVKPMWI